MLLITGHMTLDEGLGLQINASWLTYLRGGEMLMVSIILKQPTYLCIFLLVDVGIRQKICSQRLHSSGGWCGSGSGICI